MGGELICLNSSQYSVNMGTCILEEERDCELDASRSERNSAHPLGTEMLCSALQDSSTMVIQSLEISRGRLNIVYLVKLIKWYHVTMLHSHWLTVALL